MIVGCDVSGDNKKAGVEELLEHELEVEDLGVFGHGVHALPKCGVDEEVL